MKLYTSAAVGRLLGMSEKEVRALTAAGVIREGHTGTGLYKLEETAREIIANYKKPEDERENVDYMAERAKLMRIKRMSEEYNLQVRKGQLVEMDEAELVLSKVLVSFKARLSAIPSRAAPQVATMNNSADVFDLLKQMIEEALEEMSDIDKVLSGEAEE